MEIKLKEITKKAIDSQHPSVKYHLSKIETDEKIVIAAFFEVEEEDHYQLIGLAYKKHKTCDTIAGNGISEIRIDGFGPGGGGYSKDFCVQDLYFTISFSELLGLNDVSHRIDMDSLIIEMRKEIKMQLDLKHN